MPKAKLSAPASKEEIDAAESTLGTRMPSDLRGILEESNGVDGLYSSPILPLDRIVSMNQEYRTADYLEDRMPFDHLLFFGDTGNGDDFAFPIYKNGQVGDAVFMWEHETDCRQEYSGSLAGFLVHYAIQFYALRAE